MNKNIGEHYGFSREWILLVMSVMNCISVEESIPFEELIRYPYIRDAIIRRTKTVSSRPSRKYGTKLDDIVLLMDHLKMCPNYLIPRTD